MRALLWKDVRLVAPYRWLIIPGHALFAANGTMGPEILFWINVGLVVAFTIGLAVIDWRFEADRFVAALPVDRRQIVVARYLSAVAVGIIGTSLWVGYSNLFARVLPGRLGWSDQAGPWTSMEGVAVFFLLALGTILVFLPFVSRFGLGRGVWGFTITTVVLAGIGAGVVSRVVESGPRLPSEALSETLTWATGVGGGWLGWPLLLGVAAALTWASIRLSVRGYQRRDL